MSDVPLDETPSYVEPFSRLQPQTVTWLWLYRLALRTLAILDGVGIGYILACLENNSVCTQRPAAGKYRVRQLVRIKHGFRGMIGEVVEDRGLIGVHGRGLYAVKLRLDPWNEHTSELPEESLEPVVGESSSPSQLDGKEATAKPQP